MKSKENIVFLGMMGSGKSSIGSLVAKKLKLNFVDIDREIETQTKMSIKKIFEEKGENYFRKVEETITLKCLKLNNVIISLGGGGFVNKEIRKEVLKNHLSFWLNWKNSTLVNRIIKSKKRPIAFNSSKKEIKKMIIDRSKIYSMADFKLNCEKLSKNEIVNKIKEIYEKN